MKVKWRVGRQRFRGIREAGRRARTGDDPRDRVIIIGSGFSGLGIAMLLKRAGHDGFVILEQADDVGGTWRDNTYPGAACDVQSHLYSFSFEPYPEWSRQFAEQPQILEYLRHCARKYDLYPHIRFGSTVASARFDERTGLWEVRTESEEVLRARAIVSGTGGLSRPVYPNIPGRETFAGPAFHSARWDHDFDPEGKTVAVIGTGASAIQVVPALAPETKQLRLFQRTPAWVMPKPDRAIGPRERALYRRVPAAQRLHRLAQYWSLEARAYAFVKRPQLMKYAAEHGRRHIARHISDPELRKRLEPDYVVGCKRALLSNDYYPALARDDVRVVSEGIERIDETGLVTRDGQHHDVDAIVYCTGFQAAEAISPYEVTGLAGRQLNDEWRERGAEAYLGTTVSGFPNLFVMMGPNTGLGHSSMVFMFESQFAYIMSYLDTCWREGLRYLDVRPEVQRAYNDELAQRLEGTVWDTGCASWYRTSTGKNTAIWPGYTFQFRARTRRVDPADYRAVAEVDREHARQPTGAFVNAAAPG